MADIRKIIIIFVVAILFSVFVFAIIGAIYPQPEYNDYCKNDYGLRVKPVDSATDCQNVEPTPFEQQECANDNGYIQYNYGADGCPTSYECNTCQEEYNVAQDKYRQYVFYISAILALIAIFVGLYLPAETNTLNEWIGTGFMLGGAFALLFGTAMSYTSLGRFVKPIVIFAELVLIIFVAYRKVGNLRKDKKK